MTEDVRAFFRAHDDAWGRLDFGALAALWDEDEPSPVYLGEEYSGPQTGGAELQRHFTRLASRLQAATVKSEVVQSDEPAPGLARAVVLSEWALTGIEEPEPRRGRSWVTALLRKRGDEWRLVHYMEAPVYFEEPLEV